LSLDPAVAALIGLIVLGQQLGAREVAGIALVVLASVGASATVEPAGEPAEPLV
jgi:inner membrane transporter RhtA